MAARGAKLVGQWPTDTYEFEDSKALLGGKFIGMVIDDLNQPELTDERIKTWVAQLEVRRVLSTAVSVALYTRLYGYVINMLNFCAGRG